MLDADPNAEAMVVLCAAPPCQDFSHIAQGAGHQGDCGRLLEESVAFMDELRAALKSHRFALLYENVEMGADAAKVSSDALGVQPVFVCPSDFGWVSRPRFWWLSADPADGSPLEWAKKGRWDRLRLAAVRASADSFDLGGLEFHSSVAQGRKLMPCATPTDDGRAKPRSTRGRTPRDADTPDGWRVVASSRRGGHAPGLQGVLHIPLLEVKEQLHHIPPGYTAKAGADAKTRHRMVGNGWHGSWASSSWRHGPSRWRRARRQLPRHAGLFLGCLSSGPDEAGIFRPPPRPNPQVLGEGLDEESHWAAAARMMHSLVGWPSLEPALEAVLEFRLEWRHDLDRIRQDVLRELRGAGRGRRGRHGRLVGDLARPCARHLRRYG